MLKTLIKVNLDDAMTTGGTMEYVVFKRKTKRIHELNSLNTKLHCFSDDHFSRIGI